MWIDRLTFQSEHDARVKAEAINAALVAHNTALKTTTDWLMMRLTQLEYERAQLINNYMGIKIPVPTFEPETPRITASEILNQTIDFNDMGDEAAAAAGIGWTPSGLLDYGKSK